LIGLVDYGAGNLQSVTSALETLDADFCIVKSQIELDKCETVLIPGVGSFFSAITRLQKQNLLQSLASRAQQGDRVVGICLGMQLLFESSQEGAVSEGLGLLKGQIVKSTTLGAVSANRIGWDTVEFRKASHLSGDYFFAHSFEATGTDSADLAATSTTDGRTVVAAVQRDNIFGLQFHPEKSASLGLKSLKWALGLS
jgi:glutamine amidotransferase